MRRALAAAAAAVLLLAGCASGGGPGAAPAGAVTPPPIAAAPAAPASGRGGMLGLPLSAYRSDDRQSEEHFRAVRALTAKCLRDAGFRVDPASLFRGSAPADVDNDTAMPGGAWGYLGTAAAAVQGFHARPAEGPGAAAAAAAPAGSEAERSMTERCTREGLQRLQLPESAESRLVSELFGASLVAVGKDHRVVAATAAWRECMAGAGFRVEDPETLVARYRRSPSVQPDELSAARADADCTATAGLAGIWFAVLAGYQQQQIERHGEQLAGMRRQLRERADRIAAVLAENGA
ncbi:hypothetical protein [Kitasatospora terrestris]|uniref:Secreted protein n=1 Tax=Kitasatospora terrestris TaxID=258051 RepID=A0ABP9DSZ5_9ACTN